LDLQVPKNSIVGFLGPNGAGKSTTIKLLLGLIQPTGGSATVFGLDIEGESIEIRRRVGYLAQQPRFYPEMTARETLNFAARFFYSGPRNVIEERVEESLALVGLADKADRSGCAGYALAVGRCRCGHRRRRRDPAHVVAPGGQHCSALGIAHCWGDTWICPTGTVNVVRVACCVLRGWEMPVRFVVLKAMPGIHYPMNAHNPNWYTHYAPRTIPANPDILFV
jgi:hypothetical protein